MNSSFEDNLRMALDNPGNQGELENADSVGTVGSAECGDMMRIWLKFTEKDGNKVIDRASFQAFGCQTAIAVASKATQILRGKTVGEARNLTAQELAGELGPLPPMKIHCGQLVEGALREALQETSKGQGPSQPAASTAPTLVAEIHHAPGRLRIIPLD